MIEFRQCLICELLDEDEDVARTLLDVGLAKREPYLCPECRRKILDSLKEPLVRREEGDS